MTSLDDLRGHFDVVKHHIYFNHAAVSPLPLPSVAAMQSLLQEQSAHGGLNSAITVPNTLRRARDLGANLLSTHPDRIFIVRSTTQGIGVAASGLVLRTGANVVTIENEFPANVRPWLALQNKGVEVRRVPQRHGRVLIDDLRCAVDRNTAAVAISSVQFLSGFRVDLAPIATLCRDVDALLVVDAIQSLGAFSLDVETLGIDVLSADSHKWLVGPEGVGLGYVSDRALDRLVPAVQGWLSVERPFDFLDIDQPLKKTAARFEEGALNIIGLHGMLASLELLMSVGIPSISQQIVSLTDQLAERLVQSSWTILSPRESPSEKSGIVLATKPGLDAASLSSHLLSHRVVASIRGGALRFSPHAYNTLDEVDELIRILGRWM